MTEPLNHDLTEYQLLCIAVGSLFLNWADFEGGLTAGLKLHLLAQFKSVNKAESNKAARMVAAIYGSQRMKAARDTMKRLASVEDIEPKRVRFAEAVFAHIGNIETLRDKLAHQSLVETPEDHVWRLHDIMTTRALMEPKLYEIKTQALYHAAADVKLAGLRLSGLLDKRSLAGRFDLTPPTWQYKASMLKPLPKSKLLPPRSPLRLPKQSGK